MTQVKRYGNTYAWTRTILGIFGQADIWWVNCMPQNGWRLEIIALGTGRRAMRSSIVVTREICGTYQYVTEWRMPNGLNPNKYDKTSSIRAVKNPRKAGSFERMRVTIWTNQRPGSSEVQTDQAHFRKVLFYVVAMHNERQWPLAMKLTIMKLDDVTRRAMWVFRSIGDE
jgi:hypothetical protein